jgi:hypothetical protein
MADASFPHQNTPDPQRDGMLLSYKCPTYELKPYTNFCLSYIYHTSIGNSVLRTQLITDFCNDPKGFLVDKVVEIGETPFEQYQRENFGTHELHAAIASLGQQLTDNQFKTDPRYANIVTVWRNKSIHRATDADVGSSCKSKKNEKPAVLIPKLLESFNSMDEGGSHADENQPATFESKESGATPGEVSRQEEVNAEDKIDLESFKLDVDKLDSLELKLEEIFSYETSDITAHVDAARGISLAKKTPAAGVLLAHDDSHDQGTLPNKRPRILKVNACFQLKFESPSNHATTLKDEITKVFRGHEFWRKIGIHDQKNVNVSYAHEGCVALLLRVTSVTDREAIFSHWNENRGIDGIKMNDNLTWVGLNYVYVCDDPTCPQGVTPFLVSVPVEIKLNSINALPAKAMDDHYLETVSGCLTTQCLLWWAASIMTTMQQQEDLNIGFSNKNGTRPNFVVTKVFEEDFFTFLILKNNKVMLDLLQGSPQVWVPLDQVIQSLGGIKSKSDTLLMNQRICTSAPGKVM